MCPSLGCLIVIYAGYEVPEGAAKQSADGWRLGINPITAVLDGEALDSADRAGWGNAESLNAQFADWQALDHIPASETNSPDAPTTFEIGAYPNPFNPVTTLRIALPEAADVEVRVFDLLGREVTRLLDEPREAGIHVVRWEASAVPSGTYLYRVTAGSYRQTGRLILVK